MNALRIALRQIVRQPAFAATVVVTLALAIGATTAVFSVVHGVLLRGLPYAEPESLVWIASIRPDNPQAPFSLPEYMDYRSQARSLEGLAAYANWSASLSGDGVTERLQGARMSANSFEILGVSAALGRLLRESDDDAGAPKVAVLSHRLWQREYGGAADVVGRTARIHGEPFEIIGVLPAQFPLPLRGIDVVTALRPEGDPLRHERNSVNFLRLFGRLRTGDSAGQAEAELTAICGSLRQQFPAEYARKESVRVVLLREAIVGDSRPAMLLLLGAVFVVLATAIANLVSLVMVRAAERRAELSARIALGASRFHLVRQLTAEVGLLACIGAGLGCLLATQAVRAAVRWAPPSIPRLAEVRLDGTVVLFAAAVTALVAALLALSPLVVMSRSSAGDALRLSSRVAVGQRWGRRLRGAMVVGEISAALVLLLATIVLVQNLLRLGEVDPGFEPDGVLQARVSLPESYRTPEKVSAFYERLSERIRATPGVRDAGVVSAAPLSGLLATVPFSLDEQTSAGDRPSTIFRLISPGYLSTVGTSVLQGRSFSEEDRPDTPHVALVSAALAERFLEGRALGRRLFLDDNNTGPRAVEVVGVVENVRHTALDAPPAFDVYLPLRQTHPDAVALVQINQFWMVRTEGEPEAFRSTFVSHLRAVDPDAAVSDTGPMRHSLDVWLGPHRFQLGLIGAFASTAVLLAVSGLYGLVSYAVSQRAREIGLRRAIGATEQEVRRMVLVQAAALGAAGAALGVGLAVLSRPLVSRVVADPEIPPNVIAATMVVLLGVVVLAAWVPARRASRIEPTVVLKG